MADKKMSPVGQSLFDMLTDMGRAQAAIYQANGYNRDTHDAAAQMVNTIAARHRPRVIDAIKRTGKEGQHG